MLWGTYHHQNGDLTKLLKLVRKKVPQSARLSAGGGCNPHLGNAQIEVTVLSVGLPLPLYAAVGPIYSNADLYLYKNGTKLPESRWFFLVGSQINDNIGATGSCILVSNLLEMLYESCQM